MYRIIRKEILNPTVTLMEIDAPLVAKKAQPGQFIILRVDEEGERIPLTVADYDREKGTVTIIFQVVGGTTELLNHKNEGDSIRDFVGPLGRPTVTTAKKVAIVGGGVGCAIAYPVAYILSRMRASRSYILVMLFVMPMWINFVLRAMALRELLDLVGLLGRSDFLNYVNSVIGMVYDFLPFMVLPLYSTLIKMDRSLEEAAADLGASRARVFLKVTLPLSVPGIVSGAMMVFLPVMSCYVVTDTFGARMVMIIGKLIENQFTEGHNWNFGSAIALIMLLIMFITMLLTGGFKEEKIRGSAL